MVNRKAIGPLIVWLVGLAGVVVVLSLLSGQIVNVVDYGVSRLEVPSSWLTFVIPAITVASLVGLGCWRRDFGTTPTDPGPVVAQSSRWPTAGIGAALPLFLPVLLALLWLTGTPPTFVTFSLAILAIGYSIDRSGTRECCSGQGFPLDRVALGLLILAIAASTLWHTLEQTHFWRHFLLGYADFGFFTTELEHCLPWKEVGATRFVDTRMGYHAVWMFYLLVPFYALFRSPVFLMVVGPLALNLAAVPFYQLAKARTNSPTIGLLVGLTWLALPSISRLPYSNTYGFQSIYLSVPWLAWCFTLAMRGRWHASHLCLAAAMLCEETVCGVAFGWGVYLFLWGGRRRSGLVITAAALAYLFLCTGFVIPHFAAEGMYTRLKLFGDLTGQHGLDRLLRPRVFFYVMVLTVPLLSGLWRRPRLLIAAVPTLLLILLLHQRDYLNIKYWHQSSMLAVLFTAATLGVTAGKKRVKDSLGRSPVCVGPPVAMLVVVLLFQQWLGSSPFAQSQRIYAAEGHLRSPDPRMQAVDFVRETFSLHAFAVVATERMAAHFTSYRMVVPALRAQWDDRDHQNYGDQQDHSSWVLVVDRSDRWDKIGMEHGYHEFLRKAVDSGYVLVREMGPVLIFVRKARPGARGPGDEGDD